MSALRAVELTHEEIDKITADRLLKAVRPEPAPDPRPRARPGEASALVHSVPKTDECVLWPYALDSSGFGVVGFGGRTIHAHKAAFLVAKGRPPQDGAIYKAVHSCQERTCVNPRHLSWKSDRDLAMEKKAQQKGGQR